jgi:hypothetical protein
MKIVTAIAVIASIVFVGWTRNRLVKYEASLEALETEGLVQEEEEPQYDRPFEVAEKNVPYLEFTPDDEAWGDERQE